MLSPTHPDAAPPPGPTEAKPTIHTLVCKRDLATAMPCLLSVSRALKSPLVLHDDGTLVADDFAGLLAHLPNATAVTRLQAEEQVLEHLARYPACRRYRSEHPFSIKLFDIPLSLPSEDSLHYIDSDFLFFRQAPQMFPQGQTAVFCEEDSDGYSPPPWKLRYRFGFRIPSGINAGFFRFPLAKYDLDFLEWFLSKKDSFTTPGLAEQTAWTLLLRDSWPMVFDPDRVFCSRRRPLPRPDQVVAIHFLYHLKERISLFAPCAASSLDSLPPVPVDFRGATPLRLPRIVYRRLFRKWRDKLN